MLQPRSAAGRFYHAFYQWTALSFRPPTKPALTTRAHSTRRKRPQHLQSKAAPTSQKLPNGSSQNAATSPIAPPESWWTSLPISSTARPIHFLAPFEEAVRYRSDTGILIETPIPCTRLDDLCVRYGADLNGLARLSGAKVELGQADITSYTALRQPIQTTAVVFSGTFEQCAMVRAEFRAVKRKMKGELKGRREGTKQLVRFYVTHDHADSGLVRKFESESTIEPSKPPPKAVSQGFGRHISWHSYPVKSQNDMPSAEVRPHFLVLRHRSDSDDNYILEFVVHRRQWKRAIELIPLPQIREYCEAKVQISPHLANTTHHNITVEGTVAQVDRTIGLFSSLFDKKSEQNDAAPVTEVPSEFVPFAERSQPSPNVDRLPGSAETASVEVMEKWQTRERETIVQDPRLRTCPAQKAELNENDVEQTRSTESRKRPNNTALRPNVRDSPSDAVLAYRHEQAAASPLVKYADSGPMFNFGIESTSGDWARPELMGMRTYSTQSKRMFSTAKRSSLSTDDPKAESTNHRPRIYRSSKDSPLLEEDMKRALRPMTHPVAVITSRISKKNESDEGLNHCRGVTVSSFNTVTMSPKAIVSFNLRIPSRSWDAIRSLRWMTIHILAATPQGAAVAHAFTQPYERPGEPFARLRSLGVHVDVAVTSQLGIDCRKPPRLSWENAVLAQIDAKLLEHKCVELGDHIVVFAEVRRLALPYASAAASEDQLEVDRNEALAYALRGFRGVGPSIEPAELPELNKVTAGLPEYVVDEIEAERRDLSNVAVLRTKDSLNEEVHGATNEVVVDRDMDVAKLHAEEANSNAPKRGTLHQPGMLSSAGTASSSPSNQQRRSYSVSSALPTATPNDKQATESGYKSIHDMVSDPGLLSSTVDDFLGIPYRPSRTSRRMRGLVRAQNAAKEASQQLEKMLANGSLTPSESARLESVVTRNERHVAKTLALRSAQDLRRMLDEGKVDTRRAQWIESSVEKGQAVLLEEAKQLRGLLDKQFITLEQFELVKAKLEKENTLLDTELMRLRQLVEEESDGGAGVQKEGIRFDGFDRNM